MTAIKKTTPRTKTAREIAAAVGCTTRTVQRWWAQPRADYLANSISRAKPWLALGISRATWYRKGKPTAEALQDDAGTGRLPRPPAHGADIIPPHSKVA